MRVIGSRFVNLVMIRRHGMRITIQRINSSRLGNLSFCEGERVTGEGRYKSLRVKSLKTDAPSNAHFREIVKG